jgi:predicted nucleic acid-binding protein
MRAAHALPAIVVDASAVVEMIGGERTWIERFREWRKDRAMILAPAHFQAEVANALLRSVRLDATDAIGRLHQLYVAGVDVADRGLVGIADAIELADTHRLSVYDAAYLSLAMDVDGELATNDRALAKAARAEGVPVIT